MANSTIVGKYIILRDNWPDLTMGADMMPYDATNPAAGADHNQSATPTWQLGSKFRYLQQPSATTSPGVVTFVYLKVGTQNPDVAMALTAGADLAVVCPETPTGLNETLYTITNDAATTTSELTGFMAVAISAMTDTYCGWFWCGGPAPIAIYSAFTTATFVTDESVVAGEIACGPTDDTATPLGIIVAAASYVAVGVAVAADT